MALYEQVEQTAMTSTTVVPEPVPQLTPIAA